MSGLVGNDTVTGLAEAYSNANAGSGKTLSVSAYTISDGNGGNNYTVTGGDQYDRTHQPGIFDDYPGDEHQNL